MLKGNVLVVGNSGVGKSTLINAVLGEDVAITGFGVEGTTKRLEIFSSSKLPFRLIDTVGFEPGFFKEWSAIQSVNKWAKEAAEKGNEKNTINMIWFCVDGMAGKLFSKSIQNLMRACSGLSGVPIIVVVTKSYSVPERDNNIAMVKEAFDKNKKALKDLRKIIPVVASTLVINDTAYVPPEGIVELIDVTNELMPEGLKAGKDCVSAFKLERKRAMAQSMVGVAVTAGAVIGAVPIPFADAAILLPVETALINNLAKIYDIKKNDDFKEFMEMLVTAGAVGVVAKAAIGAIKAIPGVGLVASAVNAIVAGCMIAALGESSIFIFEQIALGKKSIKDIAWAREIVEAALDNKFIEKVTKILCSAKDGVDAKVISKMVMELFSK